MEQLIIKYQSIFGKSIIEFDLFDFFFHGCKRLQKKRKKNIDILSLKNITEPKK
jgi:hypothetical protein